MTRLFLFIELLVPRCYNAARLATLTRTIHEHLLHRPILLPGGLFLFGLLDGLSVRLRRPYLREAPTGFGLEGLATAFMNNPGLTHK